MKHRQMMEIRKRDVLRDIHSSCSNSTGRKREVEEHKTKFTICRRHTLSHSLPCYSVRPSFVPRISCQHPQSTWMYIYLSWLRSSFDSFRASDESEGDNKSKPAGRASQSEAERTSRPSLFSTLRRANVSLPVNLNNFPTGALMRMVP